MKILILTHANKEYEPEGINGAWEFLPYYFRLLGHDVVTVKKNQWPLYFFKFLSFRPDFVISIGRLTGLATAIQHMLKLRFGALLVHDLTDHPYFYRSEKLIRFIAKNHDYVVTPSKSNFFKYKCDKLIMNGSSFTPKKAKQEYDACYLGQVHSFYNIEQLIKGCKQKNINLKLISNIPTYKVPQTLAKCRVCVLPISWDSSTKMMDYAAMGKPVVALRPNLAEQIGFPAYYTADLVSGIRYLLDNPKKAEALGKAARQWFMKNSGTWKDQAKKYLVLLNLSN